MFSISTEISDRHSQEYASEHSTAQAWEAHTLGQNTWCVGCSSSTHSCWMTFGGTSLCCASVSSSSSFFIIHSIYFPDGSTLKIFCLETSLASFVLMGLYFPKVINTFNENIKLLYHNLAKYQCFTHSLQANTWFGDLSFIYRDIKIL